MIAHSQLEFAAVLAAQHPEHVVIAPITSTRTVRMLTWNGELKTHQTTAEYLYRPAAGRWYRVA